MRESEKEWRCKSKIRDKVEKVILSENETEIVRKSKTERVRKRVNEREMENTARKCNL